MYSIEMNKKSDSQKWKELYWSQSPKFLILDTTDILIEVIICGGEQFCVW